MNKKIAFISLAIGGFALTLWYWDLPRERLVTLFTGADPYRQLCWLLTAGHYAGWITAGFILRNPIFTYCTLNTYEYGILFQVNGNTRFDLYPFGNFIFLEGINAQLFALVYAVCTGALALTLYNKPLWGGGEK